MRRVFLNYSLAIVVLASMTASLRADVTLPSVLADHMVLQRNRPVHLWGMADPGESVTVHFRGNIANTEADTLGRWSVFLPPGDAGGPFELTLQGKNTIKWNDVLVGDIWLASGQSNMEIPMSQTAREWQGGVRGLLSGQQELDAANHPRLRLFHVKKVYAQYPMSDLAARTWTACTPESVSDFSSVAYFFGRDLLVKENVPIGIIESDYGGTPAEAWTSLRALGADASLMPVFAARAEMEEAQPTNLLEDQVAKRASDEAREPLPVRHRDDANTYAPGVLFNAMISPLIPLQIRGVIWYQGESNTTSNRAPTYARLFPAMIKDWRARWGEGNFPFIFVQLANISSSAAYPTVRDAQRRTLFLVNTGMAVTIDIGNPKNIHPADKTDVGYRLALWARAISYGEAIEDSGPLLRQAVPENGRMRIWFDHASGGLVVKGSKLLGFEVAGSDGEFAAAEARTDGDSVIASSASVPKPLYVRYAWAGNPDCNLYNGDNLPASPFSSVP